MSKFNNKKFAILTESVFEEAYATVFILSPERKSIRSWNQNQWRMELNVDKNISDASIDDYDAVLLPGGTRVMDTNKLHKSKNVVAFAKSFSESGKPIAAIFRGPQTLIETGVLKEKGMTSYPAIKADSINAGVNWVDKDIVVDDRLITSRSPTILNKTIFEEFTQDVRQSAIH